MQLLTRSNLKRNTLPITVLCSTSVMLGPKKPRVRPLSGSPKVPSDEWDGRGKHEEEAFAGHTLGCIRLMVTDNNIEPFHYQNWGPIEHFAAQGVIKDSIWLARMGCLGLKARVDIPAGTIINVGQRPTESRALSQQMAHQRRK